jgi:hypothetical protein
MSRLVIFIAAMACVVLASNYLVQIPVQGTLFGLNLADLFTWGAFTYPIAFLVTDLTNRQFGPRVARIVVLCGFVVAIAYGLYNPNIANRIVIASGAAFILAQMLDVSIFDALRNGSWWRAPVVSSVLGSALDTVLFFSLAFAAQFMFLGANDAFAIEASAWLGSFSWSPPRWVSWATVDFFVKIAVAAVLLLPYRLTMNLMAKPQYSA